LLGGARGNELYVQKEIANHPQRLKVVSKEFFER
jgi:hypothetical protein